MNPHHVLGCSRDWDCFTPPEVPTFVWNQVPNHSSTMNFFPPRTTLGLGILALPPQSRTLAQVPEPSHHGQVTRLILTQPPRLYNWPWIPGCCCWKQQCHCLWPRSALFVKFYLIMSGANVHFCSQWHNLCPMSSYNIVNKCRGFVFPSYCWVPQRIFFWCFHKNTSQNTALISIDLSGKLANRELDERNIYLKKKKNIYIYVLNIYMF